MQPAQPRLLNNRYELLDALGRGGMATVYRGRDTRLGRPVAIKLLHTQYVTDTEFLQRFAHEAQAAAGLSAHPNIVDVYDVGQDNGAPYIVMELIEGRDLSNIIEAEGPLPPERTIRIAEQVADGLEYAHQHGFVHRDVKPHNVMVTANDLVKITDFGIAKSIQSTAVTQAGMTFGTADYISPEQAQGLGATARSDIYSLGAMVYEMLTKHLPFVGDNPMAVALQQIKQIPPPLSQWNPAIPPSLERIVLNALDKDPRQRPASAKAFASMLREYRSSRNQQTVVAQAVVPTPQPSVVQRPQAPTVVVQQPVVPVPQQPAPARPRTTETMPAVQAPPPRRFVAPPAAPPPLPGPVAPRRSGFPFGALLLGLLLLSGLLGLAYLAFATDTLQTLLGGSPAPTAQATTPPTEPTAQVIAPTDAPVPSATPVILVQIVEFVGRSEIDVRQRIADAGLVANLLEPRQDPAPAGTIIEQDPPAGTLVPKGGTVSIRVSLGPPPPTAVPPSPTPAVLELPNLAGQRIDDAQVALTQSGFRSTRIDEPNRVVPAGQIINQSPPPGSYPPDTIVTLTVSQGDVVAFPAIIGRDRPEAEQLIANTPDLVLELVDEQGPDRLPNFDQLRPNQVVSATADGQPVQNDQLVPRTARIILGVRRP